MPILSVRALLQKQAVGDTARDVDWFCSQYTLSYDGDKQRLSAVIPLGNEDEPWGFSEGAANLYHYVGNGGKPLTYNISPRNVEADILLNHPRAILEYRRKSNVVRSVGSRGSHGVTKRPGEEPAP